MHSGCSARLAGVATEFVTNVTIGPVRSKALCHAQQRNHAGVVHADGLVGEHACAADAVGAVVAIRAQTWPNLRMIEFADDTLGRNGDLIAAVRQRHRTLGKQRPELVQFMIDNGRIREVEDLID